MAGRIRSIKPEILSDAKAGNLDHASWRLWVSMWLLADDSGRLPAEPAFLAGQVFWATTGTGSVKEASRGLATLREMGLVTVYKVRGQQFAEINGWSRHQRIDKPSAPKFPGKDQADSLDSPRTREGSANPPGGLDADGNRKGIGREEEEEEEEDGASPALRLWALQEKLRQEAIPGSRSLALTKPRKSAIEKLLQSGYAESDLAAAQQAYADAARRDPSQAQWFNGETNWREGNVARQLGRIGTTSAPPRNGRALGPTGVALAELARLEREEAAAGNANAAQDADWWGA